MSFIPEILLFGPKGTKKNPTSIDGKEIQSITVKKETEILIGKTRLRLLLGKRPYWEKLVGKSPKMVEVYKQIQRAAESDSNVLILGERGVGKEIVAHMIHWLGRRFNGPDIAINCAAIPGNLLESELFGYMKGAHATATTDKPGYFEQAYRGTIFLDEIGELSLARATS